MPIRLRFSRFTAWALGLLGLMLSADFSAAAERWFFGRSPHFELISSASEKQSRTTLVHLERFRENVLAMFPARGMEEPRVTVVLFGTESGFAPYLPRYKGKPKEVTGYFINNPDEVFIAMCTDFESDEYNNPEEIIFHEYLHLLVSSRGLSLPLWLNEGLAEVFSTLRVDEKFVEYGRPKQIYVEMLSLSVLMPIKQMLLVDHTSPDYNEETRAMTFYAQSWLLTHYLLCGQDRSNQQRLVKFLERTELGGGDPIAAFKEIFGKDVNQMELLLRNYLDGGQFYQQKMAVRPIDPATITLRPATPGEKDGALLKLRWQVNRLPQDVPPLHALAAREPKDPGPHEALAAVAMAQADVESALTHWRRAAELNSRNAFVYLMLAKEGVSRFRPGDLDERLSAEDAFRLQLWLDRALALRPGYLDAIEVLGTVESRAPNLRSHGINVVQRAVPLLADRNPTLLNIALIRWRAKDYATSRNITEVLLSSSRATPSLKAAARQLRLRIDADEKTQPAPAPSSP